MLSAMDELCERVHSLPPELFEEIKALVFTFDQAKVLIDEDYKPPVQSHISKATRQSFAEIFYFNMNEPYGKTTFAFNQPSVYYKWLSSLSKAHLKMCGLMEIRVKVPRSENYSLTRNTLREIRASEAWRQCVNLTAGPLLGDNVSAVTLTSVDSDEAATFSEWSDGRVHFSWSNGALCATTGW